MKNIKKGMLLVLIAAMSFTGMIQAVTKRYFDPRILNIEGMLNGTKAMNYGIAKRDLEELRISLKNEPKNSDRYKRFLKAEARLNAFAPARSAAAPAASQAVVPLSAAEENEALVAAEAADQDGQGAMVVANEYARPNAEGSMDGYSDIKGRMAGNADEQYMPEQPSMNPNIDQKPKADAGTTSGGSAGSGGAQAENDAAEAAAVARAAAAGVDLAALDLNLNAFDNAISVGEKAQRDAAKRVAKRQAQAFYDRLLPNFDTKAKTEAIGAGRVGRFNALEARFKSL